jgi:structural maintenance of chromosomes protein 6
MKDLLRRAEGVKYAEIKIRIRNAGSDAFKPHVFGESITVGRRISEEGGSSYRIRNARGQAVPEFNSARGLVEITDHFNLQMTNPCSILMQDTSRNFLAQATPKSKYAFFLKATQLDQMKLDFENTEGAVAADGGACGALQARL